MMGLHSFDWVR